MKDESLKNRGDETREK